MTPALFFYPGSTYEPADKTVGLCPYLRGLSPLLGYIMYHLIYVSSAVNLFSDQQLKDLLEVSRRNNSERDLSGMLLYVDGNFIQVLEGEKADVLTIYDRVSRDPRHCGVITLLQGDITHRDFTDWSMGFRKLNKDSDTDLPGYNDFLLQKNDPNQQRTATLKLLENFKSINR